MKLFYFCVLSFLVVVTGSGCRGLSEKQLAVIRLRDKPLNQEQKEVLKKYCVIRRFVTASLGLLPDAQAEEVRLLVSKYLNYPANSSWEKLLEHPKAKKIFTAERRVRYARIFGLPPDATWVDLKDTLERLRFDPRLKDVR
jgi:hypothetical protein